MKIKSHIKQKKFFLGGNRGEKKRLLWCRRMKKLEARDDEYFNKILWSDECKLSAQK